MRNSLAAGLLLLTLACDETLDRSSTKQPVPLKQSTEDSGRVTISGSSTGSEGESIKLTANVVNAVGQPGLRLEPRRPRLLGKPPIGSETRDRDSVELGNSLRHRDGVRGRRRDRQCQPNPPNHRLILHPAKSRDRFPRRTARHPFARRLRPPCPSSARPRFEFGYVP